MHRTRVLIFLGALAAVLAAIAILGRAGDGGPVERVARQLIPGVTAEEITSIAVERGGAERIVLVRRGDRFVVSEPVAAPADPAAVRDLLGTLELLAWRRRVTGDRARDPARGLDPPRATLRVGREGKEPVVIRLGAPVEEARGAWIQIGGRPEVYLVEAYAARALDRGLAQLRSRRPLSLDPRAADRVEVAGGDRSMTLLPGQEPGLETAGLEARADPVRLERLLQRLDALALSTFVAKAPSLSEGALRIRVWREEQEEELGVGGRCPGASGGRLLVSPVGSGCVDEKTIEAIERALEDPTGLVDPRLIAGRVERAVLQSGGARLELDPLGDGGEAVRDWLSQLETSATGEIEAADPAASPSPLATIDLTYAGGTKERLLFHRGEDGRLRARREGKDFLLVLQGDTGALLEPAPWRFRSRRLLAADPIDLRRATARERGEVVESIARGADLGAWSVEAPAGAGPDPEAIERLSRAAAPIRALRAAGARVESAHGLRRPRRVVELEYDPPPGGAEPRRMELEVGAETEAGCFVRASGDPVVFELARQRCEALIGPWTSSRGG